ncbi:hypothetical protein I3760_04G097800 [Carya illinoinensis]|uniref:Uncharacterized protein n=1 Tax=Carya illinoinensis TaxID=32201 RepID=A0A922JR55_CARIL|nr:uncharacterized protein LOC122307963 [Carya illinoinensis]KAG2711866.1 hypothetical protein I3760_04G097800 [Carya illinoinensis]KAG6717398.1 hypothetical protein I3842_04G097300 [Carya illinoinensis]
MAPLIPYFSLRKVLLLYLVLFLFTSILYCACSESQLQSKQLLGRRRMLEKEAQDPPKKKTTSLSTKNQTKLIKPSLSTKNQTKLDLSGKNETKLTKVTNSTKPASTYSVFSKIELKKLNSTTKIKKLNSTSKATNSTKPTSFSSKKSSDLLKLSTPKNKTTKPTSTKDIQTYLDKKLNEHESEKPNKKQQAGKKVSIQQKTTKQAQTSWIDQEDEQDDLVSGFTDLTDLPNKFQQTLIPDLEKFSTTSKAYLTKANKEITKGFKPIVGNKYAPTIATVVSFAFILIPLLLVSLVFNRFKAYFSLQKLLIFVQIYLSIYFAILCLSALVTGLEPLKFFYATSQSTYVCLQVLQTLGYVLYLLLLLMYLILVFSTESGLCSKFLGLAQTFMGFAVGLHYYMAVFHRVVLHQPPQTNWKVHGIYATCFLITCLLANADRRKKSYLEEGGEEGKKN